MIVILGESASGKTTLVNDFVIAHPDYKKVIQYTTRPPRDGETDGATYYFISEDDFDKKYENGFFAEIIDFRGWWYGTAIEDCKDSEKSIMALSPAEWRQIKLAGVNTISVYLNVDKRSRMIQMLCRGDDINEVYRRITSDEGQFAGIKNECNFIITNEGYSGSPETVMNALEGILGMKEIPSGD